MSLSKVQSEDNSKKQLFHLFITSCQDDNLDEVKFVLGVINKLIIQFEKHKSSNGDVLGVSEGNWFDNP